MTALLKGIDNMSYADKYKAVKIKMHLITYGSKEYRTMQKLMNYYYEKLNK
jgi:hypothetical protein